MASQINGSNKRKALLLSLVGLPLILISGFTQLGDDSKPIQITGTIQAKEIPLASKVGGRIAQVTAREGEFVKAGTRLIEFEVPELDARRAQLQAAVERNQALLLELKNGPRQVEIERAEQAAAQARTRWQMLAGGYRSEDVRKAEQLRSEAQASFDLLDNGYRKEDIAQARAQMEQARTQADWAHQDFLRFKKLTEQGAVSARDADELHTRWQSAERAYDASLQAYEKAKSGPRTEELQAAKARLNAAKEQENLMHRGMRKEEVQMARHEYLQAEAAAKLLRQGTRFEQVKRAEADLEISKGQLQEIDAQLQERNIIAPADAEISVMDLHPGEVFAPNRTLATLTRLDDIWTRVYLPERQLARARVGQQLKVKVDAYPGKVFRGKIVQIPGVAEFTPRNVQTPEERSAQVFGVKITLENPDHLLRGGMNAEVELPASSTPWQRLARLSQ